MHLLRLFIVIPLVLLPASPAAADDVGKFYEDNCAMCHAIGGPPGGGAPDLKGITSRRDHLWLVRFMVDPDDMVETDPIAKALVKEYDGVVMPEVDGVTPRMAEDILKYIEAIERGAAPARGDAASPAAAPQAAAPARTPTPGEIAAGREFYEGRRTLTARGPSCVSCHALGSIGGLGGGTLGPDLTLVHQRLGGTTGLSKWLGNPPTRVMRAVFRSQPLTPDETFALVALLGDTGAQPPAPARPRRATFFAAGAAVAVLGLAAMGAIWSRRFRAVRRPLVERARVGGER